MRGPSRAVITAGTGPVGLRAAGLLAKAGADVVITSRQSADAGAFSLASSSASAARCSAVDDVRRRARRPRCSKAPSCCSTPARPASRSCRATRGPGAPGCAPPPTSMPCPPLGHRRYRGRPTTAWSATASATFGALGVGNLKMKIHKACIARLFERNDLVLDAETIAEVAGALVCLSTAGCKGRVRVTASRAEREDDGITCPESSGSTRARSASICAGSTTAALFLDRSLPTAEALADPRRSSPLIERAGAARSRRRALRLRPAADRRPRSHR